jgi:hypothetical protein
MALQLPASIALVGNLERLAQKSDNQPYLASPKINGNKIPTFASNSAQGLAELPGLL